MAAPHDPEKEPRRHRAPIIGIIAAVLVVLLAFVWWLQDETGNPEMPGEETYEEVTPPGTAGQVAPADEMEDADNADEDAEDTTSP